MRNHEKFLECFNSVINGGHGHDFTIVNSTKVNDDLFVTRKCLYCGHDETYVSNLGLFRNNKVKVGKKIEVVSFTL